MTINKQMNHHSNFRILLVFLFYGIISTTGMSCQSQEPPAQTVNEMENEGVQIEILVGDQKFSATLVESETARNFLTFLPMTVNMSDLNDNEKFVDLSQDLPRDSTNPGTIQIGDLMLWGSNTLVVFYKSFSTSYPYTRLGKVDSSDGLVQALGEGNVEVTFLAKPED